MTTRARAWRLTAILGATTLLFFGACTREEGGSVAREDRTTPASAPPLDEARAVHVLRTLDDAEIDLARLAHERATRPDVRELADMVMADHGAARSRLDAWAASAHVEAMPNDVSAKAAKEAADMRARLEALPPQALDRAYVDSQVTMHRQAIAILDEQLAPGAEHPDFRALLGSLRGDLARHLAHATTIRDGLPG